MIPTRRRRLARPATLLVLALSLAGGRELRAQLLVATGIRDLAFGTVLPGVPSTVPPSDAVRSGQFDIAGPILGRVEITFTLPATLSRTGGATMPISFGPISAGYSAGGSIAGQTAFDPRTPFRANLSAIGRGSVFLGGTLSPPGSQGAGSYTASVTVTVALVGL
jgi:hypothetical protein